MSALESPRGHAVRADGQLKDASEMEWTYDNDESVPFPSASVTIPATDDASATPPSEKSPHPFFTHTKQPARIIAGTRRSTRTSRPSQRVREANETPLATSSTSGSAQPFTASGTKRKAPVNLSPAPARRLATKVVVASDDDHDEQDGYETEPAEDDDANDADVSSQSLQAMADADHKVKSYIS
jgi:hypothetical protein